MICCTWTRGRITTILTRFGRDFWTPEGFAASAVISIPPEPATELHGVVAYIWRSVRRVTFTRNGLGAASVNSGGVELRRFSIFGGKMREHKRKSGEPKGAYRVRNWSEYNAGLIARGSLTMWIDESAFMSGSEGRAVKRGRPQTYSDAVIQAVLTLKHVYHLTLRAAQGFAQSRRELAFAERPRPTIRR